MFDCPEMGELTLKLEGGAVIDTFPEASSWTVRSWQSAIGATLSSTVIVAVHVDTFPFTSVTVSVTTLLVVTSAQVKASSSRAVGSGPATLF